MIGLQAALDGLPDHVAIIDSGGTIVVHNEAWRQFARENGDPELAHTGVGQDYLAVCDRSQADEAAEARAGLEAVITRKVPSFTLEYPCSGTSQARWFAMSATLMSPGDGVVVVHRDITRRYLAEQGMARSYHLEALGGLAAGIAHEINTPLQYIGDNLRFLRDAMDDLIPLVGRIGQAADSTESESEGLVTELVREYGERDIKYLVEQMPEAFRSTAEGIERVSAIVRAMKAFSYQGPAQKAPVNLNELITKALLVSRHEWHNLAESVLDLDSSLPHVPGLVGPLSQVILNMVVNAAHAIGERSANGGNLGGRLAVTTEHDGPWVRVSISDNGPGIPESARSQLFEPFFTTKQVGKGTGQGLAMARSIIVDGHGGEITFETEIGRGTTFIIRLPIVDPGAGNRLPLIP